MSLTGFLTVQTFFFFGEVSCNRAKDAIGRLTIFAVFNSL